MPHLTPIHWKDFEKFLKKMGCEFSRQKGDHRIWTRKGLIRPIVFPADDDLPIFIIKNNLRILNIQKEEYLKIIEDL